MLGDIVHADRLKGARANMQCQPGEFGTQFRELGEQGLVEVQASRGRSHGAGMARKDRLIARLVLDFRIVRDIGREW